MSNAQTALDRFGEVLIRRARDAAIIDSDKIIDGRMKDDGSKAIRAELSRRAFNKEQIDAVLWLVPQIVDETLHHLLWTLEQEESIDIAVKTPAGGVPSLREVSDGLSGELYDWIPRFSKERYGEP